MSSSAEEVTHDSSMLAIPIDAVSLGNASFTAVSYTPGTFALAIECSTSLRIDRKIGSVRWLRVSDRLGEGITKRTLDILRPDIQKCGGKSSS